MTAADLLLGMNDIPDEYIESAQKLLDIVPQTQQTKRPRRTIRRAIIAALVAVLILAATFATAMAVSPELREAMLSFLYVEAQEPSQQAPAESAEISSIEEIPVTVSRIRVDDFVQERNTLFLHCTDGIEMNSESHYDIFTQKDGALVPLEKRSVNTIYQRNGYAYHFDFEWATDGVNSVIGYFREPEGGTDDMLYEIRDLPGHPTLKMVLLGNFRPSAEDPELTEVWMYPVLLNLETGELIDFAADLELEQTGGMAYLNAPSAPCLSEDLSKMLCCASDGSMIFADLTTSTLTDLNELCRATLAGACMTTAGNIACWAQRDGEWDEEKAKAYAQHDFYEGTVDYGGFRIWQIHFDSMTPELLFDSVSATLFSNPTAKWHGTERESETGPGLVMLPNSIGDFLIDIDPYRQVYVTDLDTGERAMIDGFLWPETKWPALDSQASPLGDKLMIEEDFDGNETDHRLTVLDLANRRCIQIEIPKPEEGYLNYCYWSDNDHISMWCHIHDDQHNDTGARWYYIYDVSGKGD